MSVKTVSVPARGGPEMKIYWTKVKVPVLNLKKGETPPSPSNLIPGDETLNAEKKPVVQAQRSERWNPDLPVIDYDGD